MKFKRRTRPKTWIKNLKVRILPAMVVALKILKAVVVIAVL
jgi:hypothetical protein